MLGQLILPLSARTHFTVAGGPSVEARNYPTYKFVKMAAELNFPCDINIPTRDFSVPPTDTLDKGLAEAVKAILAGKPLYVGCMAGRGRTGLFMAVLARCFDVPNPVEYVRDTYYSHAVETSEQYKFVMTYEIPAVVTKRIARARKLSKLLFWRKGDLTNR